MKIFKKEREVQERTHEYLDAAEKCVVTALEAILAYLSGDVSREEELHQETRELETRADDLRRSIGDKLFSGAYLPLMRGDLFGLIESLDAIPNAAETCTTFIFTERPEIPDEFREAFIEVTRESFGVLQPLEKAVKTFFKPKDKVDSIRESVREVNAHESLVDAKEIKLTREIFESTSLDLSSKLHLRKTLAHIVEISDRAEDVGDHLVLIAVKSIM